MGRVQRAMRLCGVRSVADLHMDSLSRVEMDAMLALAVKGCDDLVAYQRKAAER